LNPNGNKMRSTKFVSTSILLAVFMMLISACAPSTADNPVTNSTPQIQVEETTISASGEVVPARYATLGFTNGGQDVTLYAFPGDRVQRGQLMASTNREALLSAEAQALAALKRAELALESLEKQPSRETLAQAEAALANAEANYDSLDRAGAREIQLDAAQAQVEAAKAALEALQAGPTRTQLDSARADLLAAKTALNQAQSASNSSGIKAPFDGEVVEVYIQSFESVSPGQPVILLADMQTLHVETTDLSEVDAASIKVGDTAEVSFDALPETTIAGKVTRIASKDSGGSSVNFTIYIELNSIPQGLRWGMTAFVIIPLQ
jgi:multidrug efflux pump subunit AcrA (membrane-fusion protein)